MILQGALSSPMRFFFHLFWKEYTRRVTSSLIDDTIASQGPSYLPQIRDNFSNISNYFPFIVFSLMLGSAQEKFRAEYMLP